jgi:apolipoprotein N-acyltransferase
VIAAVPAIAGAACVLGFAPFYWWPVPIVALAVLFAAFERAATPRRAALAGYAFGLGYFLAGVSWVYVSLHDFGSMPAPLAGLATLLFCAYLALFPALAGWIGRRFAARNPASILFMSAAAFTACEWLRGWLFTGFPWITVGTSQVPSSPLAGFAPVIGGYGVTLMVAMTSALLAAAARRFESRTARVRVLAAAAVVLAIGGALRFLTWSEPAGPPVRVALLQGNIPQELKWREEVRARTLTDYRRMIFEAQAKVVVLPETALPAFLDQLPADYLAGIREHAAANGKDVLMGVVEREFRAGDYDYYNTLLRLTDFGSGGKGQPPLEAGGTSFAVAICYEDIFGEELIDQLPRAQALVNVSNDAWFGRSLAAEQHLHASQLRAMETSRWMVRATNTGASAAIDERGRVTASVQPFTAATLTTDIVPRKGQTPFVLFGNLLALAAAVAVAGAAWRIR